MSSAQVVRAPLRVRKRSSRTLDQRLSLRFPRLAAANARLIARLPPGSRLRQAVVWRSARLALEAYNRRDLDAALIGYDSEFEYYPPRSWVESGLVEACYRGAEGYRKYEANFSEAWGEDNGIEPVELIDLGDRIVLLADTPMRGKASGVPLMTAYANVSTLKHGCVVRQEEYVDHAEALEAVGLAE